MSIENDNCIRTESLKPSSIELFIEMLLKHFKDRWNTAILSLTSYKVDNMFHLPPFYFSVFNPVNKLLTFLDSLVSVCCITIV